MIRFGSVSDRKPAPAQGPCAIDFIGVDPFSYRSEINLPT